MEIKLILCLLVMYIGNVDILSSAINVRLNQNLNYSTDSDNGPLITSERMQDAKINRDRECYNFERQAKRTVKLYAK